MKLGTPNSALRTPHSAFRRAFTLVELLVVLAVIAVLLALQLPGLARVQTLSRQAQCAANLRQLALAHLNYGSDNSDRLPSWNGAGFWLWDIPVPVTDALAKYGAQRNQFYCPASPQQNADGLWNYNYPLFRVVGYELSAPGAGTLIASNANPTVNPPQSVIGSVFFPAPPASQRVLAADVIMSAIGQNSPSLRQSYQYTGIPGGYNAPGWPGHRTSHLDINGRYPSGGNVAMLDGHMEWRGFANVQPRTTASTSPCFWW